MIESGIAQGLAAFLIYVVSVPLLLRSRFGAEPASLVLWAAIALWLLTLAGLFASGRTVNFWVYSSSYWFAALSFLMIFGAIHKSISLRMLADLLERPERADTREAVFRRVVGESYRERLGIIEGKRLAARSGDRFVLTDRGRRVAGSVRAVQRFFGISRSG